MAGQDFYQVLGVPRTATQEEIQRAYRRLARTHHPDVNKEPAAEERFKEIAEAYDVLSDPDTRRSYDAFGPQFRQVPPDVDPQTWARAQARAPAGAGRPGAGARPGPGQGWYGPGAGGVEGVDLEDLFGDLLGAGVTGRRAGPRGWGQVRGADQEATLELSVEEAYRGGRRGVTLTGPQGTRTYQVDIPAGVVDGQRIRLAGQGGQGGDGAPAGDLFLVVRLHPHPRYRLDGRDLVVTLPLAPWEAALGATVAVDTPGGETKLRVPPGTSSGRRIRLRGRGMPHPRGQPGDFYADVRIMVPRHLSEQERQLLEQLASVSTFDPRRPG